MSKQRSVFAVAIVISQGTAGLAAAGGLPDIRGLSFDRPSHRVESLGATFDVGGGETMFETFPPDPVTGERPASDMSVIPHTFEVLPDPAAPDDPQRIQINTRLFFPGDDPQPEFPDLLMLLELRGSYDRSSGEIHVSGMSNGSRFHHIYSGPDPFGVFPFDIELIAEVTDLGVELNGVLTAERGGVLRITGTDAYFPFGGPGNIAMESALLLITPRHDGDPAHAVAAVPTTNPHGGIYDWHAVHVPAPEVVHRRGLEGQTRPRSGYIDPRAESSDGVSLDLGLDRVVIEFSQPVFDLGSTADGTQEGELTAAAFAVMQTGGGPAPSVSGVELLGDGIVEVILDSPIAVQQWTTFRAEVENAAGVPITSAGDLGGLDEPDRLDVAFLPGDIDQNQEVEPLDLLRFRQFVLQELTGGGTCAGCPHNLLGGQPGDYYDADRSTQIEALDLLVFRQLFAGTAAATRPWSQPPHDTLPPRP